MKNSLYLFSLLFLLVMASCQTSDGDKSASEDKEMTEDTTENEMTETKGMSSVMVKNGLKIYSKEGSPDFENAKLTTLAPSNDALLEAGTIPFRYTVENYEMGAQTENANGLANSGDGQHIHAILNNQPYMAKYKPEFKTDLEEGHYVLLSFLSRSYHESIKTDNASDIVQFAVGDVEPKQADLSAPHMFYSRPKGTYTGEDTKKLLLDWYLVNCDLSADGYKVRATINGTEFMFNQWKPYIIEGLPMGDVTIKLELINSDGNLVESPFNPVERTVTLKASESKDSKEDM